MGDLKVTADDLDRERPRLLQEVANMFEGFPALAAVNRTPASWSARRRAAAGAAAGPSRSRRSRSTRSRTRLNRYYKPRNAILALAGDFDPAAARRAIEAHFAALPAGEEIPAPGEPGAPQLLRGAAPAKVPPGRGDRRRAHGLPGVPRAPAGQRALCPVPGAGLATLGRRRRLGLGGSGVTGSPVFFTPLDDGAVVAISVPIERGEKPPPRRSSGSRRFVAETIEPKLGPNEAAATKQQLGFLLGLGDLPDAILGQNPYGVAFSLARRDQLGLDPARLERAIDAVTDQDLRRVAAEVFAPGRHAGAIAGLGENRP